MLNLDMDKEEAMQRLMQFQNKTIPMLQRFRQKGYFGKENIPNAP
jgi:hypothetical protein